MYTSTALGDVVVSDSQNSSRSCVLVKVFFGKLSILKRMANSRFVRLISSSPR